jgi:hypothetical protein
VLRSSILIAPSAVNNLLPEYLLYGKSLDCKTKF